MHRAQVPALRCVQAWHAHPSRDTCPRRRGADADRRGRLSVGGRDHVRRQLIDVRIGSNKAGQGQQAPVAPAIVEPDYLVTDGHDITLLKLASPSKLAPTPVAGASERSLWTASTLETIAGWGTTSEGGDTPSTLQEAQVPITTDAYCGGAYSDFDPQTMVCAGFPQGGVDTCQGDSGGPLFGKTAGGALRVVGATSFGDGCARPGKPGVYARVADTALREWIRSEAPDAVDP